MKHDFNHDAERVVSIFLGHKDSRIYLTQEIARELKRVHDQMEYQQMELIGFVREIALLHGCEDLKSKANSILTKFGLA